MKPQQDNVDPMVQDPNKSQRREPYRFSPDELRVLKECNKESFYQRCLPISAILGFSTYYGVKSGFLRPSPRFGATPKVIVSVIVGYFIGKFSYQSKCAEKLMQLPNSKVGEMLRQRRRGNLQESLDAGFGPSMSLAPFSNVSSQDTYTDVNPYNSLDIDTTRPDFGGLDERQRPSVDNPIYEEEMPPEQKNTTTYEELRRKNREEYQHKRVGNYRPNLPSAQMQPPQQQVPSQQTPNFDQTSPAKNKYGDIWG